MFSSSHEQRKFKHWFFEKFVLHSQHYSSLLLFILMSGVMVDAEMYDTNNKRSLGMSEFKKERCLNFRKFVYFVSKFMKRTKNLIDSTDS